MSPAGRGAPSSRLLFNARSETLSERPTFRSAFKSRRCFIPANGFYEWQAVPEGKAPMWIHRADDQPFAFDGLYGHDSAAILTTDANSLMRSIHARMPVILSANEYAAWLDRHAPLAYLRALLAPREWDGMAIRPVSRAVNRAGTDGPGLVEAVEGIVRLV